MTMSKGKEQRKGKGRVDEPQEELERKGEKGRRMRERKEGRRGTAGAATQRSINRMKY